MPAFERTEILVALLSMAVMMTLWAMIVAWCWLIWRMVTGQPAFPERPLVNLAQPRWRAGTVLLVMLAYIAVQVLTMSGYSLIGDRLPSRPVDLALDEKKTPMFHLMLLNAVVDVMMIVLIPVVTKLTSGARLHDFGLSFAGWWRQAAVGVLATLIAAPPVFAIQALATMIFSPHAHPLQEILFKEFSAGVAGVAVVTAVMIAPMFEELAFRGLLQSWLVAVLVRRVGSATTNSSGETPGEFIDAPVLATVLMQDEPEPELAREAEKALNIPQAVDMAAREPISHSWLAIVLTSLLFAAVHAPQWPAPIALFVLALVIGAVYHSTGSLIAAIFTHATFNGLSTLLLFGALLIGQEQQPHKVTGTEIIKATATDSLTHKQVTAAIAPGRPL